MGNATEMANDTIVSALDPVVPADEDVSDAGSGRRKLLQDQPPTNPTTDPPTDPPTDIPESITGGDPETPPAVPETPAAPEEPSTEPIGGDDTATDAGDADDDDDDD